jgi:glycosyltransferase involved in cell wall biosynthesis
MKLDSLKGCKVLIICVSDSWGGREQIALSDAEELRNQGIPTRLYCNEGSPLDKRATKLGIPCDYAPFFFRRMVDLILVRSLKSVIEKNAISVVHTHNSNLLGSLVLALRKHKGIALFFSRHVHKKEAPQYFLSRWVMDRVDYFLTTSESLASNAKLMYTIKERKIQIIPPGIRFKFNPTQNPLNQTVKTISDEQIRAVREQFQVDPEETWIAARAPSNSKEAFSLFVKAAAGVLKLPKRVRFLLLFGPTQDSDDELMDAIKDLVTLFRIEGYFSYYCFRDEDDYFRILQSVDLIVLPGEQKGLGTTALKIMDAGTPIVLSGNDLAIELIGRGERGSSFRPGHPYNLSQVMIELMSSPSSRKEMAVKAQRYVHKNFDLKTHMNQTLSLYGRALRRRSPWREKIDPLQQ